MKSHFYSKNFMCAFFELNTKNIAFCCSISIISIFLEFVHIIKPILSLFKDVQFQFFVNPTKRGFPICLYYLTTLNVL